MGYLGQPNENIYTILIHRRRSAAGMATVAVAGSL
jgi:hypothetical protein